MGRTRPSRGESASGVSNTVTPPVTAAPDLLSDHDRDTLRQEAKALRPEADRRVRRHRLVASDGRTLCAVCNWYSGSGEVSLRALQTVLPSRLVAILGRAVTPTNSSYLYYSRGDFLGLHRDHPNCELTVLVRLSGPCGKLRLYPELTDVSEGELNRLVDRWAGFPPGGIDVDLRAPVILRGSAVPHGRPPHPYDGELAIATFCYKLDSRKS